MNLPSRNAAPAARAGRGGRSRRQFGPRRWSTVISSRSRCRGSPRPRRPTGRPCCQGPQSFTITFDQSVVDQIETAFAGLVRHRRRPGPADDRRRRLRPGRRDRPGRRRRHGDAVRWAAPRRPVQESIATTDRPGRDDPDPTGRHAAVRQSRRCSRGPTSSTCCRRRLLALAFGSVTDSAWYTATGPIPIAAVHGPGPGADARRRDRPGTRRRRGTERLGLARSRRIIQSAVALYRFSAPRMGSPGSSTPRSSPTPSAARCYPGPDAVRPRRQRAGHPRHRHRLGSATPTDPELVQDLPAGTYYLGVSAAGNLPGTPPDMTRSSGKPGTAGTSEPAGVFELQVSATPALPPTSAGRLQPRSRRPPRAVPDRAGPDLLRAGRRGPLTRADQQETALTVVDASGRTWPISRRGRPGRGRPPQLPLRRGPAGRGTTRWWCRRRAA